MGSGEAPCPLSAHPSAPLASALQLRMIPEEPIPWLWEFAMCVPSPACSMWRNAMGQAQNVLVSPSCADAIC